MEQVAYWNKEIETLPRERLEEIQLQRFRERIQYVYDRSPMYKRKYDEAGIKPSDIRTLDDIQHVPFTVKEELRESQAQHPPWGDFICIPPEEGVRVFQTTGTTGIPVKAILNKRDWTVHFYEQFMHYMHGYGVKTSDILFVPFGYSLYIAWWGFQAALEQAGVMIVPGGAQSSQDRVKNIFEWGATVVCGTPTYLLYLGETATKMGKPLAGSSVRIVVAAGEPGANVPSTKKAIETTWSAKCYDDIGSTEISNFGFECIAQKGTHVIETMFYPDEIRPVDEITSLLADVAPRPNEMKMARQLVDSMTERFEPGKFQDEYRRALINLIESKISGIRVETRAEAEREEPQSLIEALKASVRTAKEREEAR